MESTRENASFEKRDVSIVHDENEVNRGLHTNTSLRTLVCRDAVGADLAWMAQRTMPAMFTPASVKRMTENRLTAHRDRCCWQENWTREGE